MLKFAFSCLFLLFTASSYANCVIFDDVTKNVSNVEKGTCIELQGQNLLGENLVVEGLLILKTNRDLELRSKTITIEKGGEILIKGNLLLDSGTINVKSEGLLNNKGQITLKNKSKLSLYKNSTFNNQGKFLVQDNSLLSAQESVRIDNSSLMQFKNSEFLSNSARLLNKSGVDFVDSSFTMFGSTHFENQGRFKINKLSSVHHGDESLVQNNRDFDIDGTYYIYDSSSFVNDFIVILQKNANFIVNTTDMLLNNHIVDVKGYLTCSSSQLVNIGNFRLQKMAHAKLSSCFIKNEGSIRIDGQVEKDEESKIENHNIIFDSNKVKKKG